MKHGLKTSQLATVSSFMAQNLERPDLCERPEFICFF
jgi:hypothetical protein